MTEYLQWVFCIGLDIVLANKIRSPQLRKWVGLCMLAAGLTCVIWLRFWVYDIQLPSVPIGAIWIGAGLFFDRARYRRVKSTHPLLIAPTVNLAPDFPDDPLMRHLLQRLHEDIGLPKHQTISLNTSINHDLGGTSREAKQMMAALKQDFGIRHSDYNNHRYFKRPGLDAHLRFVEKGSEGKAPLTIDMLYRAIKAKRWDTQALEAKRCQTL